MPSAAHFPNVRVLADPAEVARAAASEVLRRAADATAARGVFHLVLAGGTTPRALYEALAGSPRADFARWECWFGDERCVPPSHPDSNFRMAARALLPRAGAAPPRIHRMRGEDPDPAAAAADYERELRSVFGLTPRFDLVLLGMGADGHTASLFPGTEALEERDRLVAALHAPAVGAWRLTMTFRAIDAARAVMFVVTGADKAEALAKALSPRAGEPPLPASRVRPEGGPPTWFVDRAAFAKAGDPRAR
jgi:6-phosphogluconolactonase